MTQCNICNWPNNGSQEPLIFETDYWRVLLAPNQSLLGRCYVNLRRHTGKLSALHPQEIEDWLAVLKRLEISATAAFDATLFNWQCNLNFAYKEQHPDPHIHWHFMPRYGSKRTLFGYMFEDVDFGGLYKPRNYELPPETLIKIAELLQS